MPLNYFQEYSCPLVEWIVIDQPAHKGWALPVSFWKRSLCSKLPGSLLRICAMVINETIEQACGQGSKSPSDPPPGEQCCFPCRWCAKHCVLFTCSSPSQCSVAISLAALFGLPESRPLRWSTLSFPGKSTVPSKIVWLAQSAFSTPMLHFKTVFHLFLDL